MAVSTSATTPAVRTRTGRKPVMARLGDVITWILLIGAVLLVLTPVVFMFIASFMPARDILKMPFSWWPDRLYFENFMQAIRGNDGKFLFPRAIFNSVFVAVIVSLTTILLSALTGYSLAKLRFRGSSIVFLLILSTLMIPFETIMIPLYVVITNLGLQDTYGGLIAPFLMTAFGVFLMRQTMVGFPDELLDAARIDGASEVGIFWRIVLPNMLPAAAVLGIVTFQNQWDNLIWPLLVIQSAELKTMPLYIVSFMEEKSTNEGAMVAVAALASIPMLILFFSLSRYFLQGANVFSSSKE
jgi:multiple sugar transport system permease protein